MNLFKIIAKNVYIASIITIVSIFFAFYSLFSSDPRFFSIKELHRDLVINGELVSSYPNLGVITIHFERPNSKKGSFEFELKELGKKEPYYKAKYALQDVYYLPSFPFGFPPVADSKNKIFLIKLRPSILSTKKEGIVYEMLYSFDKKSLFQGKDTIQFISGKITQYWKDLLYSNNIIFYLTPTFFFLLFALVHLISKDRVKNTEIYHQSRELIKPTFLALSFFIGYDILFIQKSNDLYMTIICIVWALLIFSYKYKSQKSFVVALFFLILCPLIIISDVKAVAEKAAIWAYMFMIMGTLHSLIEMEGEEYPNRFKFLGRIHYLLHYIADMDSQLMLWYKKITFKKQKPIQLKMNVKDFVFYILREIKEYVLFMLYVIIFTIVILSLVTIYTKVMSVRDRKLKNPTIQIIEPTLVYPATKVLLFGNSFGSKIDDRYRLMKDGVEVRPDYWEDHKIIFTIPLGWKTGFMNIWIERPVQWNGETIIEKTKPVQIKLLPVGIKFTPDDDLYFEQMKTWKEETEEINGYN